MERLVLRSLGEAGGLARRELVHPPNCVIPEARLVLRSLGEAGSAVRDPCRKRWRMIARFRQMRSLPEWVPDIASCFAKASQDKPQFRDDAREGARGKIGDSLLLAFIAVASSCAAGALLKVNFSNRHVDVKRLLCVSALPGSDALHGVMLLFGIGVLPSHDGGRKKGRRHLSRVLATWPIRFTLRARPARRPVKDILPPAGGTLLRS